MSQLGVPQSQNEDTPDAFSKSVSSLAARMQAYGFSDIEQVVGPKIAKRQGSQQAETAVSKPPAKLSEFPFFRIPRSFLPLLDVKTDDGFSYTSKTLLILGYIYTVQSMNQSCAVTRKVMACNLGMGQKHLSTLLTRLIERGNVVFDEKGNLRVSVASLGTVLGIERFRASDDFLRVPFWFSFWSKSKDVAAFVYGDVLSNSLLRAKLKPLSVNEKADALHISKRSVDSALVMLRESGLVEQADPEKAKARKPTNYRALDTEKAISLALAIEKERRAALDEAAPKERQPKAKQVN